jgi:hypothetical protein
MGGQILSKRNRLDMKYKTGISITILVLTVGFVINYYFNPYAKRFRWLENEIPKYKTVEEEDSLNNKITESFRERGSAYITLDDERKVAIGVSRNGLYEKSFIGDFVQAGDSLYKKSGSDTFYIYRDKERYYFILGKIINED